MAQISRFDKFFYRKSFNIESDLTLGSLVQHIPDNFYFDVNCEDEDLMLPSLDLAKQFSGVMMKS